MKKKIEIDLTEIVEDRIFMSMEKKWFDEIEKLKREILQEVEERSKLIAKEIIKDLERLEARN